MSFLTSRLRSLLGASASPVDVTVDLPADLLVDLEARAASLTAALPGWRALPAADLDSVRGSLRLYVEGSASAMTLAVSDLAVAGHIVAMTRLNSCQVRLVAQGPRVAVLVTCEEWVYALSGFPALA